MEHHHTVAVAVEVALFYLERQELVAYPSFAAYIEVADKKKKIIQQMTQFFVNNKNYSVHTCCNKCLRPGLLDITGRICIRC